MMTRFKNDMFECEYNSDLLIRVLGGTVKGKQHVVIRNVATISEPQNNSLLFFSAKKWKDEYVNNLRGIKDCFIIVEPQLMDNFSNIVLNNCVVSTGNARLYFANALKNIINSKDNKRKYKNHEKGYVVGENVHIGENCLIEPFVFIDHDVVICDNVTIKSGVKIRKNVVIEDNVTIGENSVIGAQGFGIEKDEANMNIRIPHIGGVLIKENVEVGALTSIVSGTISPTIVEKNVFIDDLNHIAHNCYIGEGTLSTAAVQVSGSAKIGANSYISPNSTIRNGISVGNNCFIGQASSVQKSFGDNVSIVGSPAKIFNKEGSV